MKRLYAARVAVTGELDIEVYADSEADARERIASKVFHADSGNVERLELDRYIEAPEVRLDPRETAGGGS
jgi:hypothetical protein